MTGADDYRWWHEALAENRGVETERGNVRAGFYRNRNEAWAFWRDGGTLKCWSSSKYRAPTMPDEIEDRFAFCCEHPVTHEDFLAFQANGLWPEQVEPAVVPEDLSPKEKIEVELADYQRRMTEWMSGLGGPISNQPNADKAANYAEAFAALEKRATEQHTIAKAPHLAAGRTVDAEWKPVIAQAAEYKKAAKAALVPFLSAEKKRITAKNLPPDPSGRVETPLAGSGRKVHLTTRTAYVVTDRAAFLTFLARQNDLSDAFMDALEAQAERMMKAGMIPPGVEKREVETAA